MFEKSRTTRYTVTEALRILTESKALKCSKQPLKVRENASFLIDLKWFSEWEDIKADMNGVYNRVLRCGIWTLKLEDGLWSVVSRKKIPLTSPTMFHLVLNSKANKAQPALVRSLFLLKNAGGGIVGDACLLQYYLTNGQEQVKINVQTHGNCRKTNPKPFQTMKKSSLRELQEGASSKPSRQVYDDLRQRSGGICGSISLCDLPRGRHQVYDAKSKARERGNDDVGDLLKYARDKEDLVLHHSDVPEDLWVLGTSSMCSELERSTSSDILSHPFSVDPTFSLGKFEVTPVVFKNLLLKSKRTGGNPIFLGPKMIHHSKSETTYQMLATTCVRKCSSLTNAKGFITDGETALQNAFQEQLKHSQSLRCFKHFENNCKNKLRDLGIKSEKDQKYFLAKTFGVRGKEEGIIDAVDGKDLRKRLRSAQNEVEEQERLTLGKDEQYAPKYWSYLNDNRKMVRRHMVDDVRRKAGLMDGENGKPKRCYTNCSESMNNIMKAGKNTFTKESGATHLTKLQFTRHVFEAIHDHQVEEFQSAVAGVSDEYVLADHSKYLQVPADVWFDWSPKTRNTYIGNIQKLSMEDIFQQKDVPWPSDNMSEDRFEFRDLEVDVAGILSDHFGYSADNSIAIKREVLNLVNHPTAIQPKASLATKENLKFEVASPSARNGSVLVTVYSDHVGCVCGRYRHDNICKHSIAVAARQSILSTHFNFLKKKSKKGSHTALAEYDVNKNTAGKKGARNKNSYRPERYCSSGVEPSNQARQTFTEIHHNENQFVLMFLPQEARTCKSCEIEFCRRKQVIPFNMVFAHKERWLYPVDGDWSKAKASKKETNRFYHTAKKCILKRFPYFNWEYVEIPSHVADSLSESHRKYLRSEFQDAVV